MIRTLEAKDLKQPGLRVESKREHGRHFIIGKGELHAPGAGANRYMRYPVTALDGCPVLHGPLSLNELQKRYRKPKPNQ